MGMENYGERMGTSVSSKEEEKEIITGECDEEEIRIEEANEKIEKLVEIINQYKEFFDLKKQREKGGVFALRHQREYFPPKAEWLEIYQVLNRLPKELAEIAERPGFNFESKNHLFHLLRNSPFGKLGSTDTITRKIVEKGGDFKPYDSLAKDSQETLYLLIYYLDFLENNKEVLEKELTSQDGWLEQFKERGFFLKDTEDGKLALERINFLARLENNWTSSLGHLRGLREKSAPIEANNFLEEFNRLQGKNLLDKDKIGKFYGLSSSENDLGAAANF